MRLVCVNSICLLDCCNFFPSFLIEKFPYCFSPSALIAVSFAFLFFNIRPEPEADFLVLWYSVKNFLITMTNSPGLTLVYGRCNSPLNQYLVA